MENIDFVIVTYATHAQGMYNELMQSGHHIIVGGWGMKWNGFMDKIRFCRDIAAVQLPNTIFIFLDGFDTKILKDPKLAVQRFLTYDCRMLVSEGTFENTLPYFIRQRVFSASGTVANSGLYMGYAEDVCDILSKILQVEDKDDQRGLNTVIRNEPPGRVVVDTECRIFCNLGFEERVPSIYEMKDAVFIQFNAHADFSLNMFKKILGYCLEFKIELTIIIFASFFAFLALQTFEKKYNCSLGSEIFGIAFPLLTIKIILCDFHMFSLSTSRLIIGMATAMLAFHLIYFVKKNVRLIKAKK